MSSPQDNRPLPELAIVLQRLLQAGEAVCGLRDPGETAELAHLLADTLQWYAKPAEDRLVHVYTCQFAETLQIAAAARRVHRVAYEQIYFQMVGLILPLIRADYGRAVEQRMRPSP